MEKPTTFVQPFKLNPTSQEEVARKYYKIVSSLFSLNLTDRELDVLTFICINGGTYTVQLRNRLIEEKNITKPAIYNIIGDLKKVNLLKKQNKQIVINQEVLPNLKTSQLLLEIKIPLTPVHETT